MNDHLSQLAASEGLELRRPSFRTNSHLAMAAALFARDEGAPEPFRTNVYKAYWQQGRNIGLRDVVLEIAAESGLDRERLGVVLDDARYEPELAAVYDECHRHGITGVPSHIIGRYLVVGAQPYEALEGAYRRALSEEASE